MEKPAIAFIGLGAMGMPMARNLMAAGFVVTVFNRSKAKADILAAEGARVAMTPAQAVTPGGVVVTMLADDAALDAVTFGEEGFAHPLGRGGVHLSMSTVSPGISRRLAREHANRGADYVAAPVFGRPEAAAARKLWIALSGAGPAKVRVGPILEALGQGSQDFGEDPGAANVVKVAGNFLILSAIEAMSEALALAEKSGVEREALAGFLGRTVFACPVYQNYGRSIAARRYSPAGFRLELGVKDMRLVREVAEGAQLPMPLADLLRARLLGGMAKGRGHLDWAAIELASAEEGGIGLG